MPRTATATPSKTSFVKKFLDSHPQGNVKAVNEAWGAAGYEGTISKSVVDKARAKMGLAGNLRGRKTRKAAKGKAAPSMAKTTTATPGKTSFVKEFLNDHPEGNVQAVNEAWKAAGFDGTISPTLVSQMRKQLGLAGNLRGQRKKTKTTAKGKAAPTAKRRGRPPKGATATIDGKPAGQAKGRKSGRTIALEGLEAEVDRLLFKVMEVGNLPQVEETLRQTRRLLYAGFDRG
jgi:hypothetical protein